MSTRDMNATPKGVKLLIGEYSPCLLGDTTCVRHCWYIINDNRKVTMDYVKYYELITDEHDKKRVVELSMLKEEAIMKADYDKVSEIDSEINNITKGVRYDG